MILISEGRSKSRQRQLPHRSSLVLSSRFSICMPFTTYYYTVRHKKLHLSFNYWYNDFVKLSHTMTIFGTYTVDAHENIPSPACLTVFVKSKTENQLIRFVIDYLVADNNVKCETVAAARDPGLRHSRPVAS